MSILVDPIVTHGTSGVGNDIPPPGIDGQDWGHVVSGAAPGEAPGTGSLAELQAFLTSIGFDVALIRTPQDAPPSVVTYAGLTSGQRDAAVAAGALPFNFRNVIANVFDRGATSLYEPIPGV